jgi:23S rRNA (uridine2552-2'-O)-methyltransferase
LGAAPGGWAQVAVQRGASAVVGVDLLPIEPLTGATFFELDLLDEATPAVLLEALGGAPDLVLSDMAANTTGHARTDQIRTGALADAAADFALAHVAHGRHVRDQGFPGRSREHVAHASQAGLRDREARQAQGQPRGKL